MKPAPRPSQLSMSHLAPHWLEPRRTRARPLRGSSWSSPEPSLCPLNNTTARPHDSKADANFLALSPAGETNDGRKGGAICYPAGVPQRLRSYVVIVLGFFF